MLIEVAQAAQASLPAVTDTEISTWGKLMGEAKCIGYDALVAPMAPGSAQTGIITGAT